MDYYNTYCKSKNTSYETFNNNAGEMTMAIEKSTIDINRNTALEDAIMMIKSSIASEKDDEIFYSVLLSQAPTEEDKRIIMSIINYERKHNKMFKELYQELTKQMVPQSMMSRTNNSSSEYLKNLEKALFGELAAVEKYRKIMAAMPDKDKYSMLMEIMNDDLKHAHTSNLLIAKNIK